MIDAKELQRTLVIEAGRPGPGLLREAWHHRELLALFAWRDIAVRYKQTILGFAWALLRPLLMMLVFVAVFAYIVRVPSPDTPYSVLVLAGLVPWFLLASSIANGADSLSSNSAMLSKVYFPRILLPLSSLGIGLVDFLVGLALLVTLMLWAGVPLTWRIAALPGFVLLTLGLGVGVGLWLSAATVRFRDLRHVVPFILQVGLYSSPVAYPSSIVPERWQLIYAMNPAVGLIDGYRWSLLGSPFLNLPALGVTIGFTLVALLLGLAYFRRVERSLVDVL